MSAMTACPDDHPLMIAWNKYKATEDFTNTRKWALHEAHVDGSLWAAFMAGFNTRPLGEAGEDPHQVLHLYDDDSAFVVRGNGNKTLHGVQRPELLALFEIEAGDTDDLVDGSADQLTAWWVERLGRPDNRGMWKARALAAESSLAAEKQLREQAEEAIATQNGVIVSFGQRVVELERENEDNRKGFEFHAGRAERERDGRLAAEQRVVELTAERDGYIQAAIDAGNIARHNIALTDKAEAALAAAETQMRAKDEAIARIAKQKLPHELSDEDADSADYQGAYETIVSSARALAPVTTPPAETGERT